MDLLADLARSGLSQRDARLMHVEAVAADVVKGKTRYYDTAAYKLPYFEPSGKTNSFYRLRFLEPVHDLRTGKLLRYWQPPRTPPHVYFPPHVDWPRVLKDPKVPLIITEGEKKAAAGAKLLKRPVLGLGGVWSWGSKQQGEVVLPELVPYLKDREVLICFDHDPQPKPDVTAALIKLSRAARAFGATPRCLPLPQLRQGEKAGLDDVLVRLGPEAVLAIEPTSFEDVAALETLNDELAFIEQSNAFYHLPSNTLFQQPQRLTQVVYSTRTVVRYDARGKAVERNLAAEWIKWPQRRTHAALAYEPGESKVLGDGRLNVWPGLGVEPKRGDVSMYLKLLDQVFADDKDGAARRWILQWLAYPLAHPGTKLYCGVLMFSLPTGVGKSLLAETMRPVYGDNFISIEADDLHAPYNGWARHRQFILGDEVTGRERREDENRLKNLLTRETVTINEKYQVTYQLLDKANVWLTTNHPDALSLADSDRRWFVYEILRQTIPDQGWYTQQYHHWYRQPENAAAVLWYLLNKVDLKGFDPRGKAPATLAKTEMQELSNGAVDYQVRELLAAPDQALAARDLYRASELAAVMSPTPHPVALAKALRRAGVHGLGLTKTWRGIVTLYPIRNAERWTKASHVERATHYNAATVQPIITTH